MSVKHWFTQKMTGSSIADFSSIPLTPGTLQIKFVKTMELDCLS